MTDDSSPGVTGAPRPTRDQALTRLAEIVGVPLGDALADAAQVGLLTKGGVGSALDAWITGSSAARAGLDLADGELKTYNANADGTPKETVSLVALGAIDDLLAMPPFDKTLIYERMSRLLMVGIHRPQRDPASWRIMTALSVDTGAGSAWFPFVRASYQDMLKQFVDQVHDGRPFSTVTAAYMQIRVKDGKPYTPTWSERAQRVIAPKRLGVYLTRRFVQECLEESIGSGEVLLA